MITDIATISAADRHFLKTFLPDEEGAPWMAVTDWHLLALIAALLPLRWFADRAHPEWTICSEMAVYFPVEGGRNYVVPDLFVALAPPRHRRSFDSEAEGGFPLFVLEIISMESQQRDTSDKVRLYGVLGVQEYAIFDPEGRVQPQLQGHHRNERGEWAPWTPGPGGELRSRVLGLTLVVDGTLLRLADAAGTWLLTPDQERARADQEQQRADQERSRADQERARADQERLHTQHERGRADQERSRADQERARAEAAEAQIATLRALLAGVQPPD